MSSKLVAGRKRKSSGGGDSHQKRKKPSEQPGGEGKPRPKSKGIRFEGIVGEPAETSRGGRVVRTGTGERNGRASGRRSEQVEPEAGPVEETNWEGEGDREVARGSAQRTATQQPEGGSGAQAAAVLESKDSQVLHRWLEHEFSKVFNNQRVLHAAVKENPDRLKRLEEKVDKLQKQILALQEQQKRATPVTETPLFKEYVDEVFYQFHTNPTFPIYLTNAAASEEAVKKLLPPVDFLSPTYKNKVNSSQRCEPG
mmetsp:Transcript_15375/g.43613  ORF Transcript_15375/g.43613 Transcript_15375/m.43613 type:complete len:255 (+) Transcript_15375:57-821(+)